MSRGSQNRLSSLPVATSDRPSEAAAPSTYEPHQAGFSGDLRGSSASAQRSSADLLKWVDDNGHRLDLADMRTLLRHPYMDGEVIRALASNRRLMTSYQARSAVARHARTPEQVAMRYLAGLFWRDLNEITLDVQLRASIRRVAQRYVLERLPRLTMGEQIHMARRSVPSVAERLIAAGGPRVTAAGLANPRLTEAAVVRLVMRPGVTPLLLAGIAEDAKWGARYDVRLALCRQPHSPFRVILGLLDGLRRDDLEAVAQLDQHSIVIRHRAEELIQQRTNSRLDIQLGDNPLSPSGIIHIDLEIDTETSGADDA